MTIITSEIRQAIEQAGDRHLEMFDRVTNKTYFLVTSERLQGIRDWLKPLGDLWSDPVMDVYELGFPQTNVVGPAPTKV